jgi:hypothetical protein
MLIEVYLATHSMTRPWPSCRRPAPVWHDSDHYRLPLHTQQGLALQGRCQLPEAASASLKAVSLAKKMRHGWRIDSPFSVSVLRVAAFVPTGPSSPPLASAPCVGNGVDPTFAAYGSEHGLHMPGIFAEGDQGSGAPRNRWPRQQRQTAKVALRRRSGSRKSTCTPNVPRSKTNGRGLIHRRSVRFKPSWSRSSG